ncbi:helix-turn-helix domain-containing protein [Devosia aurantiaca]|uniref:Chromosomal replication initiator DnaA C-terminal domain-containing protein n=1 Tax=Devosia aurantiaca TaxID=2714858 RepID=A0A6M1T1C4_9HYPH|nr:helix-turn-helix domain-containing protein [Devosia aurantiaca]NGP18661.1 hypothetical protein [Devosia aurantiaca]
MMPTPYSDSDPLPSGADASDQRKIERVIELVAREYDVSKLLILHHSRCRASAARARQVAMYLSHVVLGQSLVDVGRAFGRDRTTVSHACGLIEDQRDDLEFDARLDRFEAILNGGQA